MPLKFDASGKVDRSGWLIEPQVKNQLVRVVAREREVLADALDECVAALRSFADSDHWPSRVIAVNVLRKIGAEP